MKSITLLVAAGFMLIASEALSVDQTLITDVKQGHDYRVHQYIPYNYYHNGHRYYPRYSYQPYAGYTYGTPYVYYRDASYEPQRQKVTIIQNHYVTDIKD